MIRRLHLWRSQGQQQRTSVVHSSLRVVEDDKSHLLRSTDRRIAPAMTMLYKRASQDVAQPMRLCALYVLPLPPALSQPFTQQNNITALHFSRIFFYTN